VAAKDPEIRVRAARAAALTRWGRLASDAERDDATRPARAGQTARFEREAIEAHRERHPDGPDLTPAELARAAESLRQAHMIRMSLKAARLKRERAAKRKAAGKDAAA
jgi:hypothetical protein